MRKTLGMTLSAAGMFCMLLGFGSLFEGPIMPAQAQALPSPRPTVVPLPQRDGRSEQPSVEYGHVTGTVIDGATGTPRAGVVVMVGEMLVTTDANGNYDHWAPIGMYTIRLLETPPEQPGFTVEITAGGRTVQHLLIGALAAQPLPQPTAAPVIAVTSIDLAAAPAVLPATGVASSGGWLWLPLGALLLVAGVGMLVRPARRAEERATRARQDLQTLTALMDRPLTMPAPTRDQDELDMLRRLLSR